MPELYAEYTEGSSNKYYRVEWLTTDGLWRLHYGRIGDEGTYKDKQASDGKAAEAAARKQFSTKTRKGYVQKPRPEGAIPFIRPLEPTIMRPESTGTTAFGNGGRSLL